MCLRMGVCRGLPHCSANCWNAVAGTAQVSDASVHPATGCRGLPCLACRYTGIGGVFNKLLKKNKEEVLVSDDNKNKPWIMW